MNERKVTPELLEAFDRKLLLDEKSAATREKYLRDVRRYACFIGENDVSKEANLQYKQALESNYTPASANSMLAAVNAFLRFAGWPELCMRQFRVQKNVFCTEEQELTREEYARLVAVADGRGDERLALILQTVCATGIRISELPFITLEAVQRGEAVVSCKGKTRRVFLVADLRRKLLRYARRQGISGGMIFVTRSGRPMDRSNIWKQMKALCAQAGVLPEKVFPHNLRHLFARAFYSMDKDIAKLADILGHASINTTRIYIISSGEEHRRKMERLKLVV